MSYPGQPPGPGQTPAPGPIPDPQSPPAGWYADPGAPGQLRYWDGSGWTVHTAPDPQAGQWAPDSYAAAAHVRSPLAPSGMRWISALFGDLGRILRSAWAPLSLIGILPWLVYSAVVIPLTAILLDFGAWRRPIDSLIDAVDRYEGTIPLSVQEQLWQEFEDAASGLGWGRFVAWLMVTALLSMLVFSAQLAASYKIGAEAASGRPAGLRVGMSALVPGSLRILGYSLILSLGLGAVMAALVGVGFALWAVGPGLSIVMSFLLFPAYLVLSYWVLGRLQPGMVRAALPGGQGSLGWSWRVTKGRTWAVVGRWFLVTIVVSFVAQTVIGLVSFALMMITFLFAASGSLGFLIASSVVFTVVIFVLSGITGSLTAAASAPIFRDLTDDPAYRSIEDGEIVPVS